MTADDALDRGKPYAGPLKVLEPVEPLEGPEELARVGHVEPGAVVAHEIRSLVAVSRGAELYPRLRFLVGELPGIAEQVPERDPQQPGVSARPEAAGDDELDPALRVALSQLVPWRTLPLSRLRSGCATSRGATSRASP